MCFIVISLQGYNRCCLVGHDWGGTVAWLFAIHYPEMVTKLIVLNCPHPSVFAGTHIATLNSSLSVCIDFVQHQELLEREKIKT